MTKPIDQISHNELSPTLKSLAKAGATTDHADWIRSRGNAKRLVQFIDQFIVTAPVDTKPTPSLFTSTDQQIARVREWNKEFDWGISDEAFAEAEKSVPFWPEGKLVAVVLAPYLADKKAEDDTVTSGLERTFNELWARAKSEQHASWRWDGYDKAGSDRLRLLKGIEHPSTSSGQATLRWEVIDLGCNRNKKPMDVRSSESSPHAGILAAAALHPNWVKSMDGDKVPYVWIPGYEVQVPVGEPWTGVPGLYFGSVDRKIQLFCYWYDFGSEWAVPSFFRE